MASVVVASSKAFLFVATPPNAFLAVVIAVTALSTSVCVGAAFSNTFLPSATASLYVFCFSAVAL